MTFAYEEGVAEARENAWSKFKGRGKKILAYDYGEIKCCAIHAK